MPSPRPPLDDPFDAFCKDSEAYVPGRIGGTLARLTFAAKDIFDVAGHVTGGGNPDWKATHPPAEQNAWVVQTLVNAGATMVGKTHTDELTRGILGENAHYGTRSTLRRWNGSREGHPVGRQRRWPEVWWTLPWDPTQGARCASRPVSAAFTDCVPPTGASLWAAS